MIGTSNCGAFFSPDRLHRYILWRRWVDNAPLSRMIAFIGLNPSTADEAANDPTVTRCINYAKRWGYDGMLMLNIFAYRATEPDVMLRFADPVGPINDFALIHCVRQVASTTCCWGAHGGHQNRDPYVRWLLKCSGSNNINHLGLTKQGYPKHPLYLRADLERVPWGNSNPQPSTRMTPWPSTRHNSRSRLRNDRLADNPRSEGTGCSRSTKQA